jgi:TatD DNase family protein
MVVNASSNLDAARIGIQLAEKYSFVWATVGVHPHDAKTMEDGTAGELEKMLSHPKVVAVGEIGLDYHYDHSPRDVQKKRFREQLALAERAGRPVVIHEREATRDVLDIWRNSGTSPACSTAFPAAGKRRSSFWTRAGTCPLPA